MMIQLTQLMTREHRPGGKVINKEPMILNTDKVTGFETFVYQKRFGRADSELVGSAVIFDASANTGGPLHVAETLSEIARKLGI